VTLGGSYQWQLNGAPVINTVGIQSLLFNAYQATTVSLSGSVEASLLATNANVTATVSGNFTGNLIAASYTGVNGYEFEDSLFTTPEPGTVTLLGGGALLLFAARRRFRR
jgi:choice-of-anchor A domain-containing protein